MGVQVIELVQEEIIRGNSYNRPLSFSVKDFEGVESPFDLSVFTDIFMDFRDKPTYQGARYVRLKLGEGLTISGVDNDVLNVSMTREQTSCFIPNKSQFGTGQSSITGSSVNSLKGGVYYSDILFMVGDEVKTLARKTFKILSNITENE